MESRYCPLDNLSESNENYNNYFDIPLKNAIYNYPKFQN